MDETTLIAIGAVVLVLLMLVLMIVRRMRRKGTVLASSPESAR